MYSYTFL